MNPALPQQRAPDLGPGAAHEDPLRMLVEGLREPRRWEALGIAGWSTLVRTARQANLLGEVAEAAESAGIGVPAAAHRHLLGVRRLAQRQRLSVRWEAHALHETLAPIGVPVLLLKGAAYVMSPAGLAAGRLFGDIDILVPRNALAAVESALALSGWVGAKTDAYDQHYYRRWMHELPPMVHVHRGTVLDVHHTILPPTSGRAPDPARIVERALAVPGLDTLRVPAPEDLVLHSLTHLVHEGEPGHGLRDLHDVAQLLARFAHEPGFWPTLLERTQGNDLAGPLALGLRLVQAVFGSGAPREVLAALQARAGRQWRAPWLLPLTLRALRPAAGGTLGDAAARGWIYARAHRLRMPLRLLLPHLAVKSWRAWRTPTSPG